MTTELIAAYLTDMAAYPMGGRRVSAISLNCHVVYRVAEDRWVVGLPDSPEVSLDDAILAVMK